MEEKRKKIFITGASGFLGRHLLQDKRFAVFDLVLITRNSAKLTNAGNAKIIQGDLNRPECYVEELKSCDFVIHMAGEKRLEAEMEMTNVGSMNQILGIHRQQPTFKLIYISSAGVYGIKHHPEKLIDENSPCMPDTVYEKTKLKAEEMLEEYAKRTPIDFAILRPSNVIGISDEQPKLLTMIRSIQKGRFFFASKKAMVNYVHVDLVIEIIWQLVKKSKMNNQCYNVNSPKLLIEFSQDIAREIKVSDKFIRLPLFLLRMLAVIGDRYPEKFKYFNSVKLLAITNLAYYSAEKLETDFNFRFKESLKEGIHSLVSFYQLKGLL